MHEIIIVDPSPDDITLQQAAFMAGCNAKTLRRAVQSGILPRHYLMSQHGPQLVFQHRQVEEWMSRRRRERPSTRQLERSPESTEEWPELAELLAGLQARLGESQAMIAQLHARIEDQDRLIDRAQSTIAALTRAFQRQGVANAPAEPDSDAKGEDGQRAAGIDAPARPQESSRLTSAGPR